MNLIAGEKSNNCLEGCRLPATDTFINLQSVNSYRLEGAEMEESKNCFKCGGTDGRIVVHHLSYNPEVVVDCCWSCHQKIHRRVRENGVCPLSVKEVNKLSKNSNASRYKRKHFQRIFFNETLIPNVVLSETYTYNTKLGSFHYSSCFVHHGGKYRGTGLHYIDETADNKLKVN